MSEKRDEKLLGFLFDKSYLVFIDTVETSGFRFLLAVSGIIII